MSTTVLFIGDIHIKFSNLKDLDQLESEMLKIKDISFIVVAGDVLDTHEKIHTQLMNRAFTFLQNLRTLAPVYVLVGNHDYINNQQFLTDNHWMNALKEWDSIYIVDYPLRFENEDQAFLMVPFVPPGRFVEALDKIEDWKTSTCIFAHQEIKNCKMGCIESQDGDVWLNEWPMLISGHIHDRQKIGANVLYPGSALNHAFGSDNQGISKFSFDFEGKMEEQRIAIGLMKKKVIYKDVNEFQTIQKENLVVQNKLCLSGELKDIKAFKKSKEFKGLMQKRIKVAFKIKPQPQQQVEKKNISTFTELLEDLIKNEQDHDLEKDFAQIKV
jgi:DNA repair exonuclease SbcCD nuclease subunit